MQFVWSAVHKRKLQINSQYPTNCKYSELTCTTTFCQCPDVRGATHKDETRRSQLRCSRTKIMEQSARASPSIRDPRKFQETIKDIFVFILGCGT